MPDRFIQLEGDREVARFEFQKPDILIGRDDDVDLVLHHLSVSRHHASLERRNGALVLADLGSSNGTFLNGSPVLAPVGVEPGDEIRVADIVLVYDGVVGTVRPLRWLVALLVVLAALLAGALATGHGYWYWARLWNPTLRMASELAQGGVTAWQQGEPASAKRQIQAAYWTLYRSELLDDVPRDRVWDVGLARLGESLGGEQDLGAIFREASVIQQPDVPARQADGRPVCRLDTAPADEVRGCLEEYVRFVNRELRQQEDGIPDWFYQDVGRALRRERNGIRKALERGEAYVPTMRAILEEAKMPPLLHYLAMAESGYRPDARSPAGAVGQWQFIKATGERYGLKVGKDYDERRDPEKSTRAAAEYLRDLALEFGGDSLLLALAGYNRGENGVRRSLRTLDDPFTDRSYWTLVERELLPEETRSYVARIFAQAVAGEGGVPAKDRLDAAGF